LFSFNTVAIRLIIMADEKKGLDLKDFAKPITDRVEEAKAQTEIVGYKGTPNMPTAFKARDKHRARIICYLKAIGFKNKDISAAVGGSIDEVYRVLRSQSAQEEIERIQNEIFVTEPAKMFESILPQAVKIAVNAMMSRKTKTSVRVDAAFKFMDRALGKPNQQVEVSHSLIKDLIQKMDESGQVTTTIEADFNILDTDNQTKETK